MPPPTPTPRRAVSEVHQRIIRADQIPDQAIAVGDWDLAAPPKRLRVPAGETRARLLVRDGTDVLGHVEVSAVDGELRAHDVVVAIRSQLFGRYALGRLRSLVETPAPPGGWQPDAFLSDVRRPDAMTSLPTTSVVICTRDRPEQLRVALDAVMQADHVTEVIVVDNAPTSDATKRVVDDTPGVRYLLEPTPGLDRARNRGLSEAAGEIVAYTDDDAVVDPHWVTSLAEAFAMDDAIWAVTGLVVPFELATPAQQLFEHQGGFGRGTWRYWYHRDLTDPEDRGGQFLGAGQFGTGANMAFRRSELQRIGGFDPALDVGTPTGGGGDLNAMFEVLHHGGILVYEPRAVVRHQHRRDLEGLRRQIAGNGGWVSHVVASLTLDPALAADVPPLRRWAARHLTKRLLRSLAVPGELPADIVVAEIASHARAAIGAPYRQSVEESRGFGEAPFTRPAISTPAVSDKREAVRSIDVTRPICDLVDVAGYRHTRIHVRVGDAHIGRIRIANGGRPISRARLLDELTGQLGFDLFRSDRADEHAEQGRDAWSFAVRSLPVPELEASPPRRRTVSIVLATLDRPAELEDCLRSLVPSVAASSHAVDVIVVDNNPRSGLTPPVVREFPDVQLVDAPVRGLAAARNVGFLAATGEIVVATDDDVEVPAGWIDRLVIPFERDDVMAVCGNVLPFELETHSQRAFEDMSYLGKGDWYREVTIEQFRRPLSRGFEASELGATANAAFRRCVLDDPAVGLMNTALGPGTPAGVGEDSYLLYRVARAGHTIVYDPSWWIQHRHRRSTEALHRQLHGYFRGAVAHQLATLEFERDLRAIPHLASFASWQLRTFGRAQIKRRPTRSLHTVRFRGALRGPVGYVKARRRALRIDRRNGQSSSLDQR